MSGYAPWQARFDADLLTLQGRAGWQAAFNRVLSERDICNAQQLAVQLVAQDALPQGEAYEAFVFRTGQVPTRDNAHDYFNALMWLHLPRSKASLNALQAQAIAREGISARRGALRDFCTLLDENGMLLIAPPAVEDALRARDWHGLLAVQRERWARDTHVLPFGHALLEKLGSPYKAITAHVVVLGTPEQALRNIHAPFEAKLPRDAYGYCILFDELLAHRLQTGRPLDASHLLPLPVLGIPGWWPANEDAQFYADAAVFRPLHSRT
jgi:hypothetical protein